jgi:hypothetical protein
VLQVCLVEYNLNETNKYCSQQQAACTGKLKEASNIKPKHSLTKATGLC